MEWTSKLKKARRIALSAKTFTPCVSCIAYRSRCNAARPCSRCCKLSKLCVRSAEEVRSSGFADKDSTHQAVERPLAKHITISFDRNDDAVSILKSTTNLGWGYQQLSKLSALGYRVVFMADFLESLSGNDCPSIYMALNWASNLIAVHPSFPSEPKDVLIPFDDKNHTTKVYFGMDSLDGTEDILASDCDGLLSISFDPATLARRTVLVNSHLASLLGMHSEEYLARTANREIPLPSSELDCLLFFLYFALWDTMRLGPSREIFCRFLSGRRATLASICSCVVGSVGGMPTEVRAPPCLLLLDAIPAIACPA